MVVDILLSQQAHNNMIFVDVDMIDKIVKDAERRLEQRVKQDWGVSMTLERFLVDNRGINLKTYRTLARRGLARKMLRYYVVRYLAGLEDRVRVRIISHRDRPTIERILKKAREGAEFRSLALRESEHPTQGDGGFLPPFSRKSKAICGRKMRTPPTPAMMPSTTMLRRAPSGNTATTAPPRAPKTPSITSINGADQE